MYLYSTMFDFRVAGIPCKFRVLDFECEGSTHDCPGSGAITIELYDRKGYRAKWLDSNLTSDDTEAAFAIALKYIADTSGPDY